MELIKNWIMNNEIESIKEKVCANEVLFVMTTGSKLYGAINPNDHDVIVVVDKKNNTRICKTSGLDSFVYTIDEYKKTLFENDEKYPFLFLCGFGDSQAANESIKNCVLYGENPARDVSFYNNKKTIFERVIKFGDKNFFNQYVRNKNGNHGCAKLMSWALWYYYAFENGSLELTSEQQKTIQLCHDGNLPIECAKELRKKIIKLI